MSGLFELLSLSFRKTTNGFANAYRAPSDISFSARIIIIFLRFLFTKDRLETSSPQQLLQAAKERSEGTPQPPVPPSDVHVRETQAYQHLVGSRGASWIFYSIEPVQTAGNASPLPERPFVLYIHGGAYTATATSAHFDFLYDLCQRTGCRILMPCYPRPPHSQVTAESTLEVLVALMQELRGSKRTKTRDGTPRQETTIHSRSADQFILMGDSAGGGLAMSLMLELIERGADELLPEKHIGNAPWLDVSLSSSSTDVAEHDRLDPWLSIRFLKQCGVLWAGSLGETRSRLASPLLASDTLLKRLKGVDITMLHGTADILYPGTRDMASRLDKLGVPNRFVVGRGLPHVYPLLTTWIPEVKEAREIIVDLVR